MKQGRSKYNMSPPLICMQTCLYHHEGLRINIMKQGRSRYNMSPLICRPAYIIIKQEKGGSTYTTEDTQTQLMNILQLVEATHTHEQ